MIPLRFFSKARHRLIAILAFVVLFSQVNAELDTTKDSYPIIEGTYSHLADCDEKDFPFSDGCGNSFWNLDNFYFYTEYLYWRACDPSIFLGELQSMRTLGPPLNQTDIFREIIPLHFNWNSGLRLSAGYEFQSCNFLLDVTYTYIKSHGHAHVDSMLDGLVSSRIPQLTLFDPITILPGVLVSPFDAESTWKNKLSLVDVTLHKEMNLCNCLLFTPHIGIRAAWIDRTYHQNAQGFQILPGPDLFITRADSILESNFSSVGLRAGFDAEYEICFGFSLYGDSAISILGGKFDNVTTVIASSSLPGAQPIELDEESRFSDNFCACTAVTDLGIGLRWKTCIECNCRLWTLLFQIGWEQHIFYSQTRPQVHFPTSQARLRHDELCFEGLNFSLNFDW